MVNGDDGQIQQALLNLFLNARDAMPSGGTITISTANVDLAAPEERDGYTLPAGRYALLEVADTGPGIPRQDLNKVFNDFYRADNAVARAAGIKAE